MGSSTDSVLSSASCSEQLLHSVVCVLSEIVSSSYGNLPDGYYHLENISHIAFIQARKEIWGKVMFLHVSVHLFNGGGGGLNTGWKRVVCILL